MNNAQAVLNGMERDISSNDTAPEKVADTSEDAYGKLSKLIDTAKKIGAALGAAVAAVGTACVAAEKSTA